VHTPLWCLRITEMVSSEDLGILLKAVDSKSKKTLLKYQYTQDTYFFYLSLVRFLSLDVSSSRFNLS
jgi:hypothetical protein